MSAHETPALLRGAQALATELGEDIDPEHYSEASAVVTAVLDVDEMAQAYGVAQFGRQGWDEAPAVIRNDVREHMGAVVAMILGAA